MLAYVAARNRPGADDVNQDFLGCVDRGETFVEAAVRETLEEGGLAVKVTGVLRFQLAEGFVPRVVLLAEPDGEGAVGEGSAEAMALVPKSLVDFESCGAVWVNAEDLVDEGSDGRPPQPQRKSGGWGGGWGETKRSGGWGGGGGGRPQRQQQRSKPLLGRADYRSRDPAVLFPAHASGALPGLPIDTPAFAALEDLVRRLTMEPADPAAAAMKGQEEEEQGQAPQRRRDAKAKATREREGRWRREVAAVWEQLRGEYARSSPGAFA